MQSFDGIVLMARLLSAYARSDPPASGHEKQQRWLQPSIVPAELWPVTATGARHYSSVGSSCTVLGTCCRASTVLHAVGNVLVDEHSERHSAVCPPDHCTD